MNILHTHTLNLDYEVFSENDIKLGVTKYTAASEIILGAYSFNRSDIKVVDILQGETFPDYILNAFFDPKVIKKAWNAAFEIEQTERYLMAPMILPQWQCTMVQSARCGYPLGLDDASKALGLPVNKDKIGKKCITTFCIPRKPTKTNPASRIMPWDNPELWELFKGYVRQDVEVEMAVGDILDRYPAQPDFEHKMYVLDRQINKRGVGVDLPFIEKVVEVDSQYKAELTEVAKELTGLSNPNSLDQLKAWFEEHTGHVWHELGKDTLRFAMEEGVIPHYERRTYPKGTSGYEEFMAKPVNAKKYANPKNVKPESVEVNVHMGVNIPFEASDEVAQMLQLRKELSNTSVSKYVKMQQANVNGRMYDTIQFNGAARTGRNAGRLIQPQNLPRIMFEIDPKKGIDELDTARNIVSLHGLDMVEMCYDSVSSVLSQLIRTALVAQEGKVFKVADLSAIEARVLAWFAGEEKVLEVFRTHGKIYEATAAMMFNVPFETVTKGSEMRQRGKTASLACGYQGGPNAITTMDSDRKIPDADKPGLVKAWRNAHPNIVRFWYDAQRAAIKALQNPGQRVPLSRGAYFVTHKDALLFYLPSGRYLMYPQAYLSEGKYGPEVRFMGPDQTTGRWSRQSTYGGKLVENLVQATARDVLMVGMYNLVRAGYDIVFSVHDEIVTEMLPEEGSLEEIEKLMCIMPEWADGLPLAAEGFESHYYRK